MPQHTREAFERRLGGLKSEQLASKARVDSLNRQIEHARQDAAALQTVLQQLNTQNADNETRCNSIEQEIMQLTTPVSFVTIWRAWKLSSYLLHTA